MAITDEERNLLHDFMADDRQKLKARYGPSFCGVEVHYDADRRHTCVVPIAMPVIEESRITAVRPARAIPAVGERISTY